MFQDKAFPLHRHTDITNISLFIYVLLEFIDNAVCPPNSFQYLQKYISVCITILHAFLICSA